MVGTNVTIPKPYAASPQKRVLYGGLFYVFMYFFFYELVYRIYVPDAFKFKVDLIWLLGYQDVILVLLLILLFGAFLKSHRSLFLTRGVILWTMLIAVYFVVTAWRAYIGFGASDYQNELRVFLWFFGGASVCILLVESGLFHLNLAILILVNALVLWLASINHPFYAYTQSQTYNPLRMTSPNIFYLSALLLTPCSISIALFSKKYRYHLAIAGVSLLVYGYVVGLLGATRSNVIYLTGLMVFSGLSLAATTSPVTHMSRKAGKEKVVAISFFLFWIALFVGGTNLIYSGSLLADRFSEGLLEHVRLGELESFFAETGAFSYILGRGVAGVVSHDAYAVNSFHIGIFTIWSHFGIVPFAAVAYLFYINIPSGYVKALFGRSELDPNKRSAILATFPGLLVYSLVISISGGYHESSSFGLGLSFVLYNYIRRFGPEPLLGYQAERAPGIPTNRVRRNAGFRATAWISNTLGQDLR